MLSNDGNCQPDSGGIGPLDAADSREKGDRTDGDGGVDENR